MPSSATRVLVLGIDAANPELLEGWARDGTLPNLGRLLEAGLGGSIGGLEGFFIGSTWPSFYTGLSPAGHGFHYLVQLEPGTYDLYRCADHGLVRGEPLWTLASRAGRRVAVLDVPLTRLEPELNGIQTVEWGAHDAAYGFQTHPAELAGDIFTRYGQHPLGPTCDGTRRSAGDYRELVEKLERGARLKGDLTRDLLARGGWDFFIQVFTESHCCGHQCWHLHDPGHPAHDPGFAAEVGDPLRRVYQAIDEAVGSVLEVAGDAVVFIVNAHGMDYWYGAQFLLKEILFRLGVTAPPPPKPGASGLRARLREGAAAAWRKLPDPLRAPLGRLRKRVSERGKSAARIPSLRVDAANSLCFPINNGLAVGGIRLNLVGREPQGVLQPGSQAKNFCEALAADLLEIVDERTGEPLVRRVLRTADLYSGEYLDHLPDLLVEWSDAVPTGSTGLANGAGAAVRARSSKIGVVEGSNRYGRTGENRPGGFFVAAGPGIAPGRLNRAVSLMDFLPTFARLLGLDSHGWDGQAIAELLPNPGGI